MPRSKKKSTRGRGGKRKRTSSRKSSPTPVELDADNDIDNFNDDDIDIDVIAESIALSRQTERTKSKLLLSDGESEQDEDDTSLSKSKKSKKRKRKDMESEDDDEENDEIYTKDIDFDDVDSTIDDETSTVSMSLSSKKRKLKDTMEEETKTEDQNRPSRLNLEFLRLDKDTKTIHSIEVELKQEIEIEYDLVAMTKLKNVEKMKSFDIKGDFIWLNCSPVKKRIKLLMHTYVHSDNAIRREEEKVISNYPTSDRSNVRCLTFVDPPYLSDIASQENMQTLEDNYYPARQRRLQEGYHYPLLFCNVFAVIHDPETPKKVMIDGNEIESREMRIWDYSGWCKLRIYPSNPRLKKLFFSNTDTDYSYRIIKMDNVSVGNKNGVMTAKKTRNDGLIIIAGKPAEITILDEHEHDLERLIQTTSNHQLECLCKYLKDIDKSRHDEFYQVDLIRPDISITERSSNNRRK